MLLFIFEVASEDKAAVSKKTAAKTPGISPGALQVCVCVRHLIGLFRSYPGTWSDVRKGIIADLFVSLNKTRPP